MNRFIFLLPFSASLVVIHSHTLCKLCCCTYGLILEMLLKTEIYHVSIVKECNLEIVNAVLPYCTSLVCTRTERRQRQRKRQTELGMSKNQYMISGVRVHVCVHTQCVSGHMTYCTYVLYLEHIKAAVCLYVICVCGYCSFFGLHLFFSFLPSFCIFACSVLHT